MSNNIQYEAVFPPAIHSLRRMSHLSPSRNVVKDSYELYDTQQKTKDSPEGKRINNTIGAAPGSPGSLQDYNQIVERLQQELEESKRKEFELQQMLVDLKHPHSHNNTNFLENTYLEASPSNDSIGENVKDAHIKHLQRQVTVLQASLYKSEGWANRVSSAVRERDKALDDVARLTSEIRDIKENNHQLLLKIESLSTSLQEAQKNLHQATEQLQNHNYNGQLVAQLRDEIQRQKSEIKTLKESVNRLDLENRSLRDPSLDAGSQSFGNMACSQELEHLLKVVDKLKSTVLQQRSYLLQLRQPNNDTNAKSLPPSSAFVAHDGFYDQECTSGRKSSSPKLRVAGKSPVGSDAGQGNLHSQQVVFGHPSPAGMKSGTTKENFLETQHHISSDFVQDDAAGAGRKLNSREMLEKTYNMDVLNSPNTLPTQGGGLLGIESRHVPQGAHRNGYSYSPVNQNSRRYFGQQENEDVAKQNQGNKGVTVASAYESVMSSQHKTLQRKSSQSEALGYRTGLEGVSHDKLAKDINEWQQERQWNLASANNSSALVTKGSNEFADACDQTDSGYRLALNQGQRYLPSRSVMQAQQETQGRIYEADLMPKETHGQYVLDGNAVQMMLDGNMMAQFGNINLNSAKSQPQQIYCPSSNYQEGSVQVINRDTMSGGKMTIPAPPTHRPASQGTGTSQEVVYVNTSGDQGIGNSSSPVDLNTALARMKLDRLCPVCSNDYSHVNMDEFQTHVFECFDDGENPPQTMKPHASPDRSCPMCNARFGSTTAQTDYEKHVHSHFGEEGPGENFEFLQP